MEYSWDGVFDHTLIVSVFPPGSETVRVGVGVPA